MNVLDQANGCTAFVSVVVNEDLNLPTASASSNQQITCDSTVVALSAAGSSSGPEFTYLWSGQNIVSGQTTTAPKVSATGTFTLIVTDESNGCRDSATTIVTANITPPVVAIAVPLPLTCVRDSILINAGASSNGAAFQIGWNVHTLAYLLMLGVIFSGFYGMYAYLRIPQLMTENLGEDTLDSLLLKISDIDREARKLAISLPDNINQAVQESAQNTRVGGGVLAQLTGKVRGCPTDRAVTLIQGSVRQLKGEEARKNHDLYSMMLRKQKLVERARTDVRYKAILDFWLYMHVPMSLALLGALTAHIVSVFFYW